MGLSAGSVRSWQRRLAEAASPAGTTADADAEPTGIPGASDGLQGSASVVAGDTEAPASSAELGRPDPSAGPGPSDPASVAIEAAERLRQVDWGAVPAGDLPAATAMVARLVRHGEAALVAAAGRLEATGAAGELGWASAKDFLTHVVGGHQGTGGGLVRLAGQVADLPALAEALEAGAVSIPQARAIARQVATLPRDEQLRAEATTVMLGLVSGEHLNATDLDRRFDDVVATIDPDGTRIADDRTKEQQERGAHNARFLGGTLDGRGGVKLRGYSSVEEWELVKNTLAPMSAPHTTEPGACGGDPDLFRKRDEHGRRLDPGCPQPACDHSGRDPRDHGVRTWDALVELCDRASAATFLPSSHGTKTRLFVAVHAEDLPADQPTRSPEQPDHGRRRGHGQLLSGDRLSDAAVRRLACDSELVRVILGSEGEILDVGRAHRLVTPGLWNALVFRDRHCAFPGCKAPHYACDAHHVEHWADGGGTCLSNLILLCRRHHTVVHHTPWRVTVDPETVRPVWHPPPRVDDVRRFTYVRGTGPPLAPDPGTPSAA